MKYSTNFATDENPLSESGAWISGGATGLDWHNFQVVGGYAYGTQAGNTSFDDSIACLSASSGTHQRCRGTFKKTNQVGSDPPFLEAELLLHFSISAHSATGYELTISGLSTDSYIQINRWNGALNNFTALASYNIASTPINAGTTPATGDIFEFRDETTDSSHPLLRVYQNGVLLFQYDTATGHDGAGGGSPDTTIWTGGTPGIGHYDGTGGAPNAFQNYVGWTQFDATDGYFDGEVVQSTKTAPTSSATSTALAFGSNITQGNLLVATCYHAGTNAATFSDTRSNSWSVIGGVTNATDGHHIDIAVANSKDAGACTVTANHSADSATTFRSVIVAEFKSAFTADKSGSGTGNSAAPSSGASGTTTTAFELLLGLFGGANVSAGTPASTQGFASVQDEVGGPLSAWMTSLLCRLTYAVGSFTNAATLGSSQQWSALVNTLLLNATQSLVDYRFRNDDGDETTATWQAPELTDIAIPVGQRFRLRLQVDTSGDEPSQPLTLQFRKVGDTTWTSVTKVTRLQLSDSPNIAASAATATTAQLNAPGGKTTSSFTAGKISDDTNPMTGVDIALNFYSEFEFALTTTSAGTPGERYEFQLSGTAMTNTVVPRITITPLLASPVPIQIRMG